MSEIRGESLKIPQTVEVMNVMGKKVLASSGETIGTIDSVMIDPSHLTIEGVRIKVQQGFFSSISHYIGKTYIDKLNEEGAILNIVPAHMYIGKEVYDAEGKNIGKVKHIKRVESTNKLSEMIVEKNDGKEASIKEKDIKDIGTSVLLNIKSSNL